MRSLLEQGTDGKIQKTQGKIPCWDVTCKNPPVSPLVSGYLKFWESEVFEAYQATIQRHTEQKIRKEVEDQYKEKLKRDLEKTLTDMTVSKHLRFIEEELLTLKCPKYGHAFFDFEGCAALQCRTCSCHFCAYCLAETENSRRCHDHVRTCSVKQRLVDDKDPFFATKKGVAVTQNAIKSEMVKKYWNHEIQRRCDKEI
eukprot:Pgem_evm1s12928